MSEKIGFENGMFVAEDKPKIKEASKAEGWDLVAMPKDVQEFVRTYPWGMHMKSINPTYLAEAPFPTSVKHGVLHLRFPNCNKEWTFKVFDFIEDFCKAFPGSYPQHAGSATSVYVVITKY